MATTLSDEALKESLKSKGLDPNDYLNGDSKSVATKEEKNYKNLSENYDVVFKY